MARRLGWQNLSAYHTDRRTERPDRHNKDKDPEAWLGQPGQAMPEKNNLIFEAKVEVLGL